MNVMIDKMLREIHAANCHSLRFIQEIWFYEQLKWKNYFKFIHKYAQDLCISRCKIFAKEKAFTFNGISFKQNSRNSIEKRTKISNTIINYAHNCYCIN